MKKYLPEIFLGLIIIIAFVTRFYKLGITPSGLYVDEAGQGYSAYSILKTGKDEFGKSFPFAFRSMTDFRTPVYTYMIVPLITLFRLNIFTVRLPSAFFGFLTIPIFYLLILEITEKKSLALISSLLLAISPWSILFSRGAYETNVSLFFVVFGLYLLYKSLKKPYLIIISAVIFAISITAYQSERVIIPLILIALFIKYKNIFWKKNFRPYLIISILAGLIAGIPVLSIALTPGFWARAAGLNIFAYTKHIPEGYLENYVGWLSFVINSSWFLSIRELLSLYFSYLSPRFMFALGDYQPRTSFPELSTFFTWQFPFYVWGLIKLLKNQKLKTFKFLILSTLLIFPIPAAITWDPYSTIRSLPLVIPQISIISFGIYDIYLTIKNKYLKISGIIIFILLVVYSVAKLYSSIFILNDFYRASYWDYGWQEVAQVIESLHTDLPIVVDNSRGDIYLQLAFFLKYDPTKYQNENFEVPLNQYYTNMYHTSTKHIGTIVTHSIDWGKDLPVDEYLVGDELAISLQQIEEHKLTLISQINYPDGTVAYRIVHTNPAFEKEQQELFNSTK
jgi:4-amino-4-deoxy-L-arabinose transferase-like glycosyltransferase